jgi:hypothetical protein
LASLEGSNSLDERESDAISISLVGGFDTNLDLNVLIEGDIGDGIFVENSLHTLFQHPAGVEAKRNLVRVSFEKFPVMKGMGMLRVSRRIRENRALKVDFLYFPRT